MLTAQEGNWLYRFGRIQNKQQALQQSLEDSEIMTATFKTWSRCLHLTYPRGVQLCCTGAQTWDPSKFKCQRWPVTSHTSHSHMPLHMTMSSE